MGLLFEWVRYINMRCKFNVVQCLPCRGKRLLQVIYAMVAFLATVKQSIYRKGFVDCDWKFESFLPYLEIR